MMTSTSAVSNARRTGRDACDGPARQPISSRNNGCGRSGRLLNSGWACVPTQNGCPGSSMNSTSRLSGEVPEHQRPAAFELGPVLLVELVAVTVALAHDRLAVGGGDLAATGEHGVVGAEAHRAALVLDATLVEHEVDHRVMGGRFELGRVGAGQADDVAGEVDRHRLQPEAEPEARHAFLAGVPRRRRSCPRRRDSRTRRG